MDTEVKKIKFDRIAKLFRSCKGDKVLLSANINKLYRAMLENENGEGQYDLTGVRLAPEEWMILIGSNNRSILQYVDFTEFTEQQLVDSLLGLRCFNATNFKIPKEFLTEMSRRDSSTILSMVFDGI